MRAHFTLYDRTSGICTFAGFRVSRRQPCPICGKPDWCLYDPTRGLTLCPRTISARQVGDAGYLHGGDIETRERVYRSAPEPSEVKDLQPLNVDFRYALSNQDIVERAIVLAAKLGVTIGSLITYGLGWSRRFNAWTFPMHNFECMCIGIRLRDDDGRKWAIQGGHNGLFLPNDHIDDPYLFIEEGPTSAAALRSMGLDAIGRPSSSACVDMTTAYCDRFRDRRIVIVANRDEAKYRKDGSVFYPGQEGANKLAAAFFKHGKRVLVIEPLRGKDSRDWLKGGATAAKVMAVVEGMRYWLPEREAA